MVVGADPSIASATPLRMTEARRARILCWLNLPRLSGHAFRARDPPDAARRTYVRVSREDAPPRVAADAAELARAGVLAGSRQWAGAAGLPRGGVRGVAVRDRVRAAHRAAAPGVGVSGDQGAAHRRRGGARGARARDAVRAVLLPRAGERLSVRDHRRRADALELL